MNSNPSVIERQRIAVPQPPFIAQSYPPPVPYSVDIDNLMCLGDITNCRTFPLLEYGLLCFSCLWMMC